MHFMEIYHVGRVHKNECGISCYLDQFQDGFYSRRFKGAAVLSSYKCSTDVHLLLYQYKVTKYLIIRLSRRETLTLEYRFFLIFK